MDLEPRVNQIERRLDATTKLLQTGMKMLVKFEKENREFRAEMREVIHALMPRRCAPRSTFVEPTNN